MVVMGYDKKLDGNSQNSRKFQHFSTMLQKFLECARSFFFRVFQEFFKYSFSRKFKKFLESSKNVPKFSTYLNEYFLEFCRSFQNCFIIFQKSVEYLDSFRNVLKNSRDLQNVPQTTLIFEFLKIRYFQLVLTRSRISRIFQKVVGLFYKFQKFRVYLKIFPNVPEYSESFPSSSACSTKFQ